jgi:hypothetical protein
MLQSFCSNNSNTPLYGILINGINSTQLFEMTKPYSNDSVNLGLQTGNSTRAGSRAVIMGDSAYFAGTDGSQMFGLYFGLGAFYFKAGACFCESKFK